VEDLKEKENGEIEDNPIEEEETVEDLKEKENGEIEDNPIEEEETVEDLKEKENGEIEDNPIEEEEVMVPKKIILVKKEIKPQKGFVENQDHILKIEN